jgi:hypothetical protein
VPRRRGQTTNTSSSLAFGETVAATSTALGRWRGAQNSVRLVGDLANLTEHIKLIALLVYQLLLLPRDDSLGEIFEIHHMVVQTQSFQLGDLRNERRLHQPLLKRPDVEMLGKEWMRKHIFDVAALANPLLPIPF